MGEFLLVNLFLLAVVLIGVCLLWLVGFTMWSLELTPDDNPLILVIGCVAALCATYYLSKWLHRFVQKYV